MRKQTDDAKNQLPVAADQKKRTTCTIQSSDLFRGAKEVFIDHEGETYRLRLTRNGKLILQK